MRQFIRNLPRENITFSSSEYNNVTLANTTKLVRGICFCWMPLNHWSVVWIRTGLHPSDRKCETLINYVMEMKFDRSRPEVFSTSSPPKTLTTENLWTPGYVHLGKPQKKNTHSKRKKVNMRKHFAWNPRLFLGAHDFLFGTHDFFLRTHDFFLGTHDFLPTTHNFLLLTHDPRLFTHDILPTTHDILSTAHDC
jgi:hypothetical protein